MSKGIKTPIAQTYYVVSDIKHEVVTRQLDFNKKMFTWLIDHSKGNQLQSISLNEFAHRLNTYNGTKESKDASSGLLKGLFKNWYSGSNCTLTAPFLFFDIDVKNNDKKKENIHLFNGANNAIIFEALQRIAVITWRSKSGKGIAGILYVPQIAQFTHDTKHQHLKVGEAITEYLSNYLHDLTGIDKIEFDQAQSKFRQIRYVANQTTPRKLNPTPFEFSYKSETKVKQTTKGVIKYTYSDYKHVNGSIFEQYNNDIAILSLLQKYGFTIVSENGNIVLIKHPHSKRNNTGNVDTNKNIYFNYSNTFGGTTSFTPINVLCFFEFDNDWNRTKEYLRSLGYEDKPITQSKIQSVSDSLQTDLQSAINGNIDKVIFEHCTPLQHATNAQKYKFIADNCTTPEHEKFYIEYLKLSDYTIKYDKKLIFKKYVSEVLHDILNYADQHKKIILRAETGKGKTTAFIKFFRTHRPGKRLLILAPLTIIVDQNEKEYRGKATFLTGKSSQFEHEQVRDSNIVFATYEQGTKWLATEQHNFDYIVIDEIHQLLTANSFKDNTISELTPLLKDSTIIGLTGSPTQIFELLDYKLLDVDTPHQVQTKIEVRYSNLKAYNIALNHLTQAPTPNGKVLIRLNEIETIKALIKHLVLIKQYKQSEILFLLSTNEVKNSTDYKRLAHERQFADNYKLIFTTSLIDEGLSINQANFSDVVLIETNYNPRPEPHKQFFARFRNEDPNRKNYLYLRQKNNQEPTRFDPNTMFKSDLLTLNNDSQQQEQAKEVLNTYNHLFSNNSFYYDTGTVNPYYLAFAVTEVLFQRMNKTQYLEYLESNYNLSFTINKKFELKKAFARTSTTKELREKIALLWTEKKEQILQVLRNNTQNPRIRLDLHPTQTVIEVDVLNFTVENIKQFEKLYNRTKQLIKLGVEDPNRSLIKFDVEPITLQSDDFYRKEVDFLTAENTLTEPITKADKKAKKQFIDFATWCNNKGTFSNTQMNMQLKKIGVTNYKAFNEKRLFDLLVFFKLEVKRNRNTNLIVCSKRE